MEKPLFETIETAKREKPIKPGHLDKVNVDTTVQEKAIAFPTGARLYQKMRLRLAREGEKHEIKLRQTFAGLGKRAPARRGNYAHARQMKRAAKETRRLLANSSTGGLWNFGEATGLGLIVARGFVGFISGVCSPALFMHNCSLISGLWKSRRARAVQLAIIAFNPFPCDR